MPNRNTFSVPPIKALLAEEMNPGEFWIDPFANRNRLANVTNDLNADYDTDYHMDALDFLKMFPDDSVDGVLYDPPYSPRQVSECYKGVGAQRHQRNDQSLVLGQSEAGDCADYKARRESHHIRLEQRRRRAKIRL